MRIAVRCDASTRMGTGHLHRCLSLAEALTAMGADVAFVLRRHDAVGEKIMATKPYAVFWLPRSDCLVPNEADAPIHASWAGIAAADDANETIAAVNDWRPQWVVVDHYAFEARWHRTVGEALSCAVLAIDDLGDRSLAADVVLDGNAAVDHAAKYAGRLTPGTRLLAGPRYALLAAAYRSAKRYAPASAVRSIGIFMGGVDEHGASGAVLNVLRRDVGFTGPIEIVTTATAPHTAALSRQCRADVDASLSIDLPDLAAFYARHDLQIGAGGTSSYERACIGTPTISIVLAENQLTVVPVLDRMGVVCGATIPNIAVTHLLRGAAGLATVAANLIAKTGLRQAMSARARALVDGRGAERVALSILADRLSLRLALMDDAAMLHGWRNDPATRAVSGDGTAIAYEDHERWMAAVLAAHTRHLFVAMVGTLSVGAIRFDLNEHDAWEISLYTDPALHGLGLGSRMLAAGEAIMVRRTSEGKITFHAKVEAGNARSTRMFAQAGYRAEAGWLRKDREAEL